MDPNAMPGVAYDPSPGSYPDGNDRFVAVYHVNGRVAGFDEFLPANTPIQEAVKLALAMLPKDTSHGQVVTLDNCAALGVTSTTLQRELVA